MGAKSAVKKIVQKNKWLRILSRDAYYGMKKVKYRRSGRNLSVDEHLVVFCAYDGRSYACSPKAVYEYMLSSDDYADYRFVWIFNDAWEHRYLEDHPNTTVVRKGSVACEKFLHQAKYWIFNFRAVDQWVPTKEQVYVQCWHGTPLKRLGYDITTSDNAMNSIREIREKYRTDAKRFKYLVSSCRFVTEKFTSAWNLKDTGREEAVLEVGYPRNDFLNTFTEEDVQRIKEKLGLVHSDKKIILYAPTWRDNQYDPDKGYTYSSTVDYEFLEKQLAEDYVMLFRPHYLVAEQFDFSRYKDFIIDVSDYDDINDLYVVADLLITDYSSVFFDYAVLGRPMLFFMYDLEQYRDQMRGFYLDTKDLPGPILKTEQELVKAMKEGAPTENIKAFNEIYNARNDGEAAKRLAEIVFETKEVVQ